MSSDMSACKTCKTEFRLMRVYGIELNVTVLAPPSREARIDSRGASSMWQHGWHSQCDGGKFRNFCAVKAKRRLPSNARRSLKLT